ncbi:MAG: hypothetical protein ACK4RZ_04395 [Paracoccaceae bacterium]
MKFLQSFCVVDSSLRILWIGGDWDDFARRNGAEEIVANAVLATKLDSYIVDIDTADKVEQMIQAVILTQRTLRMDYRCDAPFELRRFRLTIKPMKSERAIMVHELRDAICLDPPMETWAFDPASRTKKCSVCGFVHEPGREWTDPTLPESRHPPFVTYMTCPSCTLRIEAAINGISEGAEAAEVGELVLQPGHRPD